MHPITLLVFSSTALEHHAILKMLSARERYVYKNEAYILANLKGWHTDVQLILREPGKRYADLKASTLQAVKLFQPQMAFLLGRAAAAGKVEPGEVLNSNDHRKSQAAILKLAPESKSFFQALQSYPEVPGIAIISINTAPEEDNSAKTQPLTALTTAALSAWQQIDYSKFATDNLDSRQLAKDVFSRLFPFPEAVREIDHDFSSGFNKSYHEVWNLLKPLLKKEISVFQKNPRDWDNQTELREKLRCILLEKKQLCQSLGALLAGVRNKA